MPSPNTTVGTETGSIHHIVEVAQFDRAWIKALFRRTDEMRHLPRGSERHRGRILATLFYEPSTRTRLSFESAMLRLGGGVISTENAGEFSSAIKGETVEDTVRIVGGYADAIVIRHHEQGAARRAASVSTVPILNGGDGPGEHPTQALLDLYTILAEQGRIDGLKIALVGDLRFGRAARSIARLLTLTHGTELIYVAPPAVPMGSDVQRDVAAAGITQRSESDLDAVLPEVDVVYQTRIQRERFATREEYEASRGVYVLNRASYERLKPTATVLHPLPRVDEISTEVDDDPRSAWFRQAANGVFVRMALLDLLLSDAPADAAAGT